MRYNGKNMELREFVECRKNEYYADLKPTSTDYWEDEGLVYAIQDYLSSCDPTDNDVAYLEEIKLTELLEDDEEDNNSFDYKEEDVTDEPCTPTPNMMIDEILSLCVGENRDDRYNTLNMMLWSLQALGAITFNEDKLDELFDAPAI